MGKWKRWTAAVLLALLPAISLPAAASAQEDNILKFREDGTFHILIIADLQDTDRPRKETIDLLAGALDQTNPDLVVFTGDNIAGYWQGVNEEKTRKAIDCVIAPVAERNIPFAVVFGNHDAEGGVTRETQMKIYQEYKGCLAVEGEDLTGCGNYNLLIRDSRNEKDIYNLWFMDSNTYAEEGGYAYVADDQIAWYERVSEELKKQNGNVPMPSLLFQHIAVPEIYELLKEVPKDTPNAVRGHDIRNDRYYIAHPELVVQGELREGPCPPNINNGQFDSWVKQGDIKGAFFGHDHVNDFAGRLEGIWLMHTAAAGFYSYGDTHGIRTVILDENNLEEFKSEIYSFEAMTGYKEKNPLIARYGYYAVRKYGTYAAAAAAGLAAVIAGTTIAVKHRKRRGKKKTGKSMTRQKS